ncbi:MAG: hypothetical protein LUE99_17225 [Bacteroides sp.]|nr:hypothetical protein [Bacteroides sp.]
MKNYIVEDLIYKMKERLPKGKNLANCLAETLCIGKEAVYRRLRGEVAFTFDEIAVISTSLGISIDQVIGNHSSNRVTVDLNLLHSPDLYESYYEIMEHYQHFTDFAKDDKSSEIYTATNTIPFTLYSSYYYLSKFRLCRWMYQNGKIKTPYSLADMQIPKKIIDAHKKLSDNIRRSRKAYFIWDTGIFHSFVKEIKYFAELGLVSAHDVTALKEELQRLLVELEHLSIEGKFNEDNELYIYLSNINFEATYSFISKKDLQISLIRVFSINSMDSQSPDICQMQKNWIQSLRRHSTLITGSGEAQRIIYFGQQKQIIETL